MKKLFSIVALLTLFACKKNGPSFSARGYWDGTFANAHHIAILNRDDGSSRLYFQITGSDTVNPQKFEGTYTVEDGVYRAFFLNAPDTVLSFQTIQTEAQYMKGLAVIYSGGGAANFELIRQR
jgi:hypothetical protein